MNPNQPTPDIKPIKLPVRVGFKYGSIKDADGRVIVQSPPVVIYDVQWEQWLSDAEVIVSALNATGQGWIPREARMPTKADADGCGNIFVSMLVAMLPDGNWRNYQVMHWSDFDGCRGATHWQPLPKHPE